MKKRTLALLACAAMLFALAAGCASDKPSGTNPPSAPVGENTDKPDQPSGGELAQGISDTEIIIGNTATTAGAFASVGVPFNAGLNAALKAYNDAGGFHGRSVRLINYNDDFDAANGTTYTQKLVEDDKVFALVGHFGTPTVGATLDYIKEKGIPMVYAATGISPLYQEGATGNAAVVFSVQPIYNAEGRVLLARALASTDDGVGLGGTKIGVIATTADDGEGLKAGVERQAKEVSAEIVYQDVDPSATEYSAAVNVLKNAGCDVVIICANQGPVATVLASMRDANYNAKVITSYVCASAPWLGELVDNGCITADRPVYATSWLDIGNGEGMAEYLEFAEVQQAWEAQEGIPADKSYAGNSYAMAGYVAAKTFIHGLDQLDAMGLDATWENFVKAMENAPVKIPMGGSVNFAGGDRLGVVDLSLNTVTLEKDENGAYALLTTSHIMTLDDLMAKIG